MEITQLRSYCGAKEEVTAEYPFGPDTLVFKVAGKMFALVLEESEPLRMNLKCDPEDALALRAQYSAITPGYHMNKIHWNTLILDDSLPQSLVFELIDHSYILVVNKLPKAQRERILSRLKEG
jgi:predicted DNA-binding protein (MmcQ/YjbR family)